jgi:hypothetical protein
MEINSYPLNAKNASSLKLVAAASLPVSIPMSSKEVAPPPAALTVALSDEALMQISILKARDTQLRQHEQAHHAASNGVDVSSASFTYQRGPNGVNYAVSGDVRIDTSAPRNPEDRLAQAEMINDVALAPLDPTPTDRAVAAKAQQMAQQARTEIVQQVAAPSTQKVELSPKDSPSQNGKNLAPPRIDTFA